ncbi:hypothetical protein AB0878_36845 [Amycolatopsis sp. NPDC047767]|uniref:hypothetical protein n=1 Tax=Amycolatopsis sp. NPDC047767 TaxID=3156765 RepID=UPI003452452C
MRFQAERQRLFESGALVVADDARLELPRVIELCQRNRDIVRRHRLNTPPPKRSAKDRPRIGSVDLDKLDD